MPLNSISTEQFVSVETIKDDCVILKDGSLRAVIMVSGTNFDLKSDEEQNLIIGAFQGLLNRLDFSVQFAIHSRKANIDGYIQKLKEREEFEENPLLKNQIKEYGAFIKTLVTVANVMAKTFYVVVPYSSGVVETGEFFSKIVSSLPFFKTTNSVATDQKKEDDFEAQKVQLKHRVDAVMAGIRPTGARCIRLQTEELLEVFYNLYNPEEKEKSAPKILEES